MTKIENYLARVRTALRGLPEREIDDILRELRSHADELAGPDGTNVDAALQSLGDPVDLAHTYRAENTMVQAECTGSALVILQGLRHATRTRAGRLLAGTLYALGYINVVSLWVAALDKLLAPSRTGLWYAPDNAWPLIWVTDGRSPAGAREVLGWWLVPAAIVAGFVLRYLVDQTARWWIRRYRRAKSLQAV